MVAGGTRLFPWIGKVLLPAQAAPGMPRIGAGSGIPARPDLPALFAALALLAGGLLRRAARRRV
jgi:hypothetical protein